jgi:hypothetical protein
MKREIARLEARIRDLEQRPPAAPKQKLPPWMINHARDAREIVDDLADRVAQQVDGLKPGWRNLPEWKNNWPLQAAAELWGLFLHWQEVNSYEDGLEIGRVFLSHWKPASNSAALAARLWPGDASVLGHGPRLSYNIRKPPRPVELDGPEEKSAIQAQVV